MRNKKRKYTPKEEIASASNPFPCAYNLYYMLDMPAPLAVRVFAEIMRTGNMVKVTEYLYESGLKHGTDIKNTFRNSSIKYREDIQVRFDYITALMHELSFRKENK